MSPHPSLPSAVAVSGLLRRGGAALSVSAVLLSGLAAVSAADSASAAPAPVASAHAVVAAATASAPWRENVDDTFRRKVRSGLGTAPEGGRYVVAAARTKVTPGRGTIGPLAPGASGVAALPSARSSDQQVRVGFKVTTGVRRGYGTFVSPLLRRQANGAAYLARVRVGAHGIVRVSIGKFDSRGGYLMMTGERAVRMTAPAKRTVIVEGRVTGQTTPVIAVRTWLAGQRQPGWQLTTVDRHPGALAGTGHIGVHTYRATRAGRTNVVLSSLRGWMRRPAPGRHLPGVPPKPTPVPTKPTPVPTKPTPAPTTPAPTPDPTPTTSAPTPDPTTTAPTPEPTPTTSAPTPDPTTTAPTPDPTTTTPTPDPTTTTPTPQPDPEPAPASSSIGASTTVADAGALPLGKARYSLPQRGIYVSTTGNDSSGNGSVNAPYATIKRAIGDTWSNGGTIVLRGGVYNEFVQLFASNVTIEAYPGEVVWMDGSIPVTGWTRSGSTWVHGGWPYKFDHSASHQTGSDAGGFVNPAYPMAAWPDQVFANGTPLAQVAGTPGAGQFSVNYASQTITVGSDPTGVAMRASNLAQAFVIGSGNVTLRGFGVRNYATSLPQMGTIYLGGDTGNDLLQDLVVRDNATQGISVYTKNVRIDHVDAWNNGMTGIHATGSQNLVINASDIRGNNAQHFNPAPAAAGIKVGRLDGFTATNNWVHDNVGVTGIWTDENVTNFKIANNVVDTAAADGTPGTEYAVLTELSDTGIVAGNSISNAQAGYTAFDTGNVQIYNNTLSGNTTWDIGLSQDDRYLPGRSTAGIDPGPNCPWVVQNIMVANNDFSASIANYQFYALDKATKRTADSMKINLIGNRFVAGDGRRWPIGWGNGDAFMPTIYKAVRDWETAHRLPVQNTSTTRGVTFSAAAGSSSVLVGAPAVVASLLGVPTDTRHLGIF